jgi:A/G-specific adenine glycosylase
MEILEFQEIVWEHYRLHGRDLPWRVPESDSKFDPYKILVSEIMLQQTQANRVIPKYESFLKRFPTVKALAEAPLSAVLAEWNGLGYNRRAKYLHEAAKHFVSKDGPWKLEDLTACKGIGPNTAAAVVVYSYNQPITFIETNIRTVFIHYFFKDKEGVHDKEILSLVEEALDREHPREWYWALMDYGVYTKATVGNASRTSKHYAKQSKFEGSKRQLRGQVLRLLKDKDYPYADMKELIPDERLEAVLKDLTQEGLVTEEAGVLHLG